MDRSFTSTIDSLTILAGTTAYLDWLVGVIGVILVGGADSSWSLLLDLARARRRLAAHTAGPAAPVTPAVSGYGKVQRCLTVPYPLVASPAGSFALRCVYRRHLAWRFGWA